MVGDDRGVCNRRTLYSSPLPSVCDFQAVCATHLGEKAVSRTMRELSSALYRALRRGSDDLPVRLLLGLLIVLALITTGAAGERTRDEIANDEEACGGGQEVQGPTRRPESSASRPDAP